MDILDAAMNCGRTLLRKSVFQLIKCAGISLFTLFATVLHAQILPQGQDIGEVGVPGAFQFNATTNTYSITGSGFDLWDGLDGGYFAYKPGSGDSTLIARVASLQNTHPWAKAGIAIRETIASDSKSVILAYTPEHGLSFQYRAETGGASSCMEGGASTAPVWLKLVRTNSLFTAYRSDDGVTWQLINSVTVVMNRTTFYGLIVSSHRNTISTTAAFDNFHLACVGIGSLPSPWAYGDLGTPSRPGYTEHANGVYDCYGSGSDFSDTADAGQFACQPMVGDGEIVAKVTRQDATHPLAKAGLFVRESLAGDARNAFLGVTPENGLVYQRRITAAQTTAISFDTPATVPAWLKLQRRGNLLSAWKSDDGIAWTAIGSELFADLSATLWVGLGVTSHDNNVLCRATFEHVSVQLLNASEGAETYLPYPWKQADIGAVSRAGLSQYAGGKWQILGNGNDLAGTADAFHFAHQQISGDSSLTLRVDSQQNTDAWARTGLMIRESLDPGAPYVSLAVTPENGILTQQRAVAGGASTVLATATGAPVIWLRIQRSGAAVTCDYSTDGSSWTTLSTLSPTLSSVAYLGIVVSSNSSDALNNSRLSQLVLTNAYDTNGNGLPDDWEMLKLGSLNNTKYEDPDNDGLNNLQEYLAGSNPAAANVLTAPYSAAVTSISDVSAGLTWQSAPQSVSNVEFNIYRNNVKIATVTGTAYVDTTVTASTSYQYQIETSEGNGTTSDKTSALDVKSLPASLDIPWYHIDIGQPTLAGTTSFTGDSMIITHRGAGLEVPAIESVHFVGQSVSDGYAITAMAKVESIDPDPKAMAGIMFRRSSLAWRYCFYKKI